MTIHALWTSGTAGSTALAAALAIAATPAAAQSLPSIRPADLLKMDPLALIRLVHESRPAPVPAEARAHILAGLPKKGEIQNLDDGARQKLAGLAPVLKAAQRETVYAIKVIDVPEAFVGLHARTVVLISMPALRLMSEDELRALVAHETAHEYIDAEYERAMADGHSGRLQDLELVCDIIAVITLHAIGQEASSLAAGIEKLLRFDRVHFGGVDHPDYPPSLLRRSTMLGLEKRISRASGAEKR